MGKPIVDKFAGKTDQDQLNAFVKEYGELCRKYGLQIVAKPGWNQTNHGTFEMAIEIAVAKLEVK